MPKKGFSFDAKKLVKSIQADINKEAKRQKLSIPVQTDVNFNHSIPTRHVPLQSTSPTNVTNNNFDNRGATIGAIGNENIVIQNINNPQMQELLELISISKNAIAALDIEDEDKEWLIHSLNSCQAEVESSSPNLSLIRRFTSTIKNDLEAIKNIFVSLSKNVSQMTTILTNVSKIYDLAEKLFGV